MDESIRNVKGIGDVRAKQLAALGVETVSDMLYFFPRRFEDRSRLFSVLEAPDGEDVTVNVRHVTFGNIFDDGETGEDSVNSIDRTLLSRYLAGWDMSAYNLDLDAADVNGDGRVTAKDRMILARYLAGWGGEYDAYFE